MTDRRAGITNMMPLSILNGDKIKIEMDKLITLAIVLVSSYAVRNTSVTGTEFEDRSGFVCMKCMTS